MQAPSMPHKACVELGLREVVHAKPAEQLNLPTLRKTNHSTCSKLFCSPPSCAAGSRESVTYASKPVVFGQVPTHL